MGLKDEDIMLRPFEEFLVGAASEEIALIRYDHFLKRRNSKLSETNAIRENLEAVGANEPNWQ